MLKCENTDQAYLVSVQSTKLMVIYLNATLKTKVTKLFFFIENPEITSKSFAFCTKNDIPLHYVSASDGTNVVKLFNEAIEKAVEYKKNPVDIEDQILEELENFDDFLSITIFYFHHTLRFLFKK